LFKGNECVIVAVYCNSMAEENFNFTKALKQDELAKMRYQVPVFNLFAFFE